MIDPMVENLQTKQKERVTATTKFMRFHHGQRTAISLIDEDLPETKPYRHGLVIGKFMPLHKWHEALISFASQLCEILTVDVCSLPSEPIPGKIRYQRTKDAFANNPAIVVDHITEELPGSSESSREVSKVWSDYLKKKYPDVDVIISSEPYGDYVAEYMDIDHVMFDQDRKETPVSGTDIRNNPFAHRDHIPDHVKWYFVKKICIVGSESTGKSTLTRLLAEHFKTVYVEEMARHIVSKTSEVIFQNLQDIATLHAKTIIDKTKIANKLLFIDTDVNITKSYAQYLFHKELEVDDRVEKANACDLHLFLEPDCTFVQDGTRLDEDERGKLSENHKKQLQKAGVTLRYIHGKSREERYDKAVKTIEETFLDI